MSNTKAIVEYMRSDIVRERFADVLGAERNAAPYITSVLLAVANNPDLQECTHESIYTSALRAATLRLSCDPATKQAHLVPFGKKATLIIGYKGLYDLAIRTGKYRYINVSKIYEGETVVEDRITGALSIEGGKASNKIAGWLGSFVMYDGYSKSVYMTVEEIHDHAKKYSKGYNRKDGAWNTSREAMERKTVLRNLITNWGYIDPSDAPLISIDDNEDDLLEDIPEVEIVEVEPVEIDPDETLHQLGYGI